MNPHRDLAVLHRGNVRRLSCFRFYLVGLGKADDQKRDHVVARVCIETLNQWTNFCRAFYLSSISGAITKNGLIALPTTRSFADRQAALDYATSTVKPHIKTFPVKRREEPPWFDPNLLLKLAASLALTNQPSVLAALSAKTHALPHLPIFRNYFAHRNQDTHRKTVNVETTLGGVVFKHPTRYLLHTPSGATAPVLDEWLIDLTIISDLMTD